MSLHFVGITGDSLLHELCISFLPQLLYLAHETIIAVLVGLVVPFLLMMLDESCFGIPFQSDQTIDVFFSATNFKLIVLG